MLRPEGVITAAKRKINVPKKCPGLRKKGKKTCERTHGGRVGSCCPQTQLVPDGGSADGGPGPAACCCLPLSQQPALLLGLPRGCSLMLYLRTLLLLFSAAAAAATAGGAGGGFRPEHGPPRPEPRGELTRQLNTTHPRRGRTEHREGRRKVRRCNREEEEEEVFKRHVQSAGEGAPAAGKVGRVAAITEPTRELSEGLRPRNGHKKRGGRKKKTRKSGWFSLFKILRMTTEEWSQPRRTVV